MAIQFGPISCAFHAHERIYCGDNPIVFLTPFQGRFCSGLLATKQQGNENELPHQNPSLSKR